MGQGDRNEPQTLAAAPRFVPSAHRRCRVIGPPEGRVLVSTDAPDVVSGQISGEDYDEQVVWRSADSGEELARSEVLPPTFIGGPVTPGFDGTHFYLGLDGRILELFTTCADSVCE